MAIRPSAALPFAGGSVALRLRGAVNGIKAFNLNAQAIHFVPALVEFAFTFSQTL